MFLNEIKEKKGKKEMMMIVVSAMFDDIMNAASKNDYDLYDNAVKFWGSCMTIKPKSYDAVVERFEEILRKKESEEVNAGHS